MVNKLVYINAKNTWVFYINFIFVCDVSQWPFQCTSKEAIKGKREDKIVYFNCSNDLINQCFGKAFLMHKSKNRHIYFYEGGYVKDQILSPFNSCVVWWIGYLWSDMLRNILLISLKQPCDVQLPFSPLQFIYADGTFLCSCLHYCDKQVFMICTDKQRTSCRYHFRACWNCSLREHSKGTTVVTWWSEK